MDYNFDEEQRDFAELHNYAFNEGYYIIGYHNAKKWLESHDIDCFDAIREVVEYEINTFGENQLKPEDINSERIVNLYVYFKGEELINNLDCDINDITKEELISKLEELL